PTRPELGVGTTAKNRLGRLTPYPVDLGDSGGRVVPSRSSGLDNDSGRLSWTVNRVHGIQRVSDRIGFRSLCCRSAAQGAGQRRMTEDLLRFRGGEEKSSESVH